VNNAAGYHCTLSE